MSCYWERKIKALLNTCLPKTGWNRHVKSSRNERPVKSKEGRAETRCQYFCYFCAGPGTTEFHLILMHLHQNTAPTITTTTLQLLTTTTTTTTIIISPSRQFLCISMPGNQSLLALLPQALSFLPLFRVNIFTKNLYHSRRTYPPTVFCWLLQPLVIIIGPSNPRKVSLNCLASP